MDSIVVFYSRTGNTAYIAQKIKQNLECDIEKIEDNKKRSGTFGYLESGFEAFREKNTELKKIRHDPSDYDIIILGTPVWAGKPSVPIRTYIEKYKQKFEDIALFCTFGGIKGKTIEIMTKLIKRKPKATLGIKAMNIKNEIAKKKIKKFSNKINN